MKQKLVWRLGKLPSVEELRQLVIDKIITQNEAREILFNTETEEDRDKQSLESEIKFLRELVEKLSQNRSQIITTIKEVEVPYRRYPWYEPYITWYNAPSSGCLTNATLGNVTLTASNYTNFSDIKTF